MERIKNCHGLLRAQCLGIGLSIAAFFAPAAQGADNDATVALSQSEIVRMRKQCQESPADPKLRYQFAEALRKSGNIDDAVEEYRHITEIEPGFFIAYHQLAMICKDKLILAEAVKRLQHLMDERPDDLMLRVAMSELLEAQGKYFEASRALINLVYSNTVPPKYVDKLNNRIRFLQSKARSQHVATRAQETGHQKGAQHAPLTLPEESLLQGLDAARLEPGAESQGFGHSRLQP